jgi:phospholipid-translocating P-type ATPase (flippase)
MDGKLTDFSRLGLRTLVFGYRILSQSEFDDFHARFGEALGSLQNREQKWMAVAEGLEKNLKLLACSAIEDRLQDNVPETIEFLLKCGIKVWVLTGDKTETAINIAKSCRLFKPEMKIHKLEAKTKQETQAALEKVNMEIQKSNNDALNGLVVNGDCLRHILEKFPQEFLAVSTRCHSVLCCRVSPLQKADVTRLVKKTLKKITLSIGDGANDVSMIQAAHVGVGIIGLEGAQAVRASDYAFTQFQCLKRLLTVHGRYSYYRLSRMIYFSLFKNLGFITICFWFGLHSGWAGLQIYQETFMAMFNVIFTSLPPLGIGTLEKDINVRTIEKYPLIYSSYKKAPFVSVRIVFEYLVLPLWHSVAVYFGLYLMTGDGAIHPQGYTSGYWVQAWMASSAILTVIMLKVALLQRTWTWLMATLIILSMAVYVGFMFAVAPLGFTADLGAASDLSSLLVTYLFVLLSAVACLLPDFVLIFATSRFMPTDEDILREELYLERLARKKVK